MDPTNAQNPRRFRAPVFVAGAAIAAAAVAAYHNSFSGEFAFDDLPGIVNNPTIRHLWHLGSVLSPPAGGFTVSGRPVLNLSLAIDYAISGTHVWSYHATNLLIHIFAGLTLFGIMRRTLERRVGGNPPHLILAFAVAVIWTLHPLDTEAVTYVIQRAESLMGLFYLLTLYFFIRYMNCLEVGRRVPATPSVRNSGGDEGVPGTVRPTSILFAGLSVAACLLGMGTKEVMVSAPVIVFLYDRTFVSGTFREAWRARWRYYLGLASTWILLIHLALGTGTRGGTAGVNVGVSVVSYWLTQFGAIMHYLRLVFWPAPLVLDYGTVPVQSAWPALPSIVAVTALAAGTVWALRAKFRISNFEFRNLLGFCGAWFFAVLAPTAVVPVISQVTAEHRMYLALAPVVAVIICGVYAILNSKSEIRNPKFVFFVFLAAVAVACGCVTVRRNEDYRTQLTLWSRTVAERPANPAAQYNLGIVLSDAGDLPAAIEHYRAALRIKPDSSPVHNNLGIALARSGRWSESIPEYEAAIQYDPGSAKAYYNLGNTFLHLGKTSDAIDLYREALRLKPDYTEAHNNLGRALAGTGQWAEAVAEYGEALKADPDFAPARTNLGDALLHLGRPEQAIAVYENAVRLRPDSPKSLNDLGYLLAQSGRMPEAIARFERAVRLKPDYAEAHDNLGSALAQTGRVAEAAEEFQAAARLQPDNPAIHNDLGCALAQLGRIPEARGQFEAALRLKPDDAGARANLDRLPAPQ